MSEPAEIVEFEPAAESLERMQDEVLRQLEVLEQEIVSLLDRLSETRQREAA